MLEDSIGSNEDYEHEVHLNMNTVINENHI